MTGDLQNVARKIQPIGARTLHVPITNQGGGRAVIHRVAASSSGHGPLTARAPRIVEAGTSSTLELMLAAPVDQAIAAGDRFDIALAYHGDDRQDRQLGFTIGYDGACWRTEDDNGPHAGWG